MTERRMVAEPVRIETRNDSQQVIIGYASVFYDGSESTQFQLWGDVFERIMPGTFDRALSDKDDARGLFNHDPSILLGRTASGTMRLSVDSKGLRYEIDLPDTTAGRDVAESIRRGDLTGSSFAFRVTDEDWRKENGQHIREVRGVQLFDAGPVTYPAYPATTTGLRGADQGSDEARVSFEKWVSNWKGEARKRQLDLAKLK